MLSRQPQKINGKYLRGPRETSAQAGRNKETDYKQQLTRVNEEHLEEEQVSGGGAG